MLVTHRSRSKPGFTAKRTHRRHCDVTGLDFVFHLNALRSVSQMPEHFGAHRLSLRRRHRFLGTALLATTRSRVTNGSGRSPGSSEPRLLRKPGLFAGHGFSGNQCPLGDATSSEVTGLFGGHGESIELLWKLTGPSGLTGRRDSGPSGFCGFSELFRALRRSWKRNVPSWRFGTGEFLETTPLVGTLPESPARSECGHSLSGATAVTVSVTPRRMSLLQANTTDS